MTCKKYLRSSAKKFNANPINLKSLRVLNKTLNTVKECGCDVDSEMFSMEAIFRKVAQSIDDSTVLSKGHLDELSTVLSFPPFMRMNDVVFNNWALYSQFELSIICSKGISAKDYDLIAAMWLILLNSVFNLPSNGHISKIPKILAKFLLKVSPTSNEDMLEMVISVLKFLAEFVEICSVEDPSATINGQTIESIIPQLVGDEMLSALFHIFHLYGQDHRMQRYLVMIYSDLVWVHRQHYITLQKPATIKTFKLERKIIRDGIFDTIFDNYFYQPDNHGAHCNCKENRVMNFISMMRKALVYSQVSMVMTQKQVDIVQKFIDYNDNEDSKFNDEDLAERGGLRKIKEFVIRAKELCLLSEKEFFTCHNNSCRSKDIPAKKTCCNCSVRYCSVVCQEDDRNAHKAICKSAIGVSMMRIRDRIARPLPPILLIDFDVYPATNRSFGVFETFKEYMDEVVRADVDWADHFGEKLLASLPSEATEIIVAFSDDAVYSISFEETL